METGIIDNGFQWKYGLFLIILGFFSNWTNAKPATEGAMLLCRVVGDVVSTVKNQHLQGNKLLLVQPVDLDTHTPTGVELIAVDHAQAGAGDLVLVNKEGGSARLMLQDEESPAQAVVVAVVDGIDLLEGAT